MPYGQNQLYTIWAFGAFISKCYLRYRYLRYHGYEPHTTNIVNITLIMISMFITLIPLQSSFIVVDLVTKPEPNMSTNNDKWYRSLNPCNPHFSQYVIYVTIGCFLAIAIILWICCVSLYILAYQMYLRLERYLSTMRSQCHLFRSGECIVDCFYS